MTYTLAMPTVHNEPIPITLGHIADPPEQLYSVGASLASYTSPGLAIVGSRRLSSYGKQHTLAIGEAVAQAGVHIISGLAIGVDAYAHLAALNAGGRTIAVLPCHPSRIYPASNSGLAHRILEANGTLLGEYPPGQDITYKYNFVERNRLISGLADAVLLTEAAANSGSLHTAKFAAEQGKTVLALPGPVGSPLSEGTNTLIKSGQAQLVTGADDVLFALGIVPAHCRRPHRSTDPHQQCLLDLLADGAQSGDALLAVSKLQPHEYSQALTMLEITGAIRALGANMWILG